MSGPMLKYENNLIMSSFCLSKSSQKFVTNKSDRLVRYVCAPATFWVPKISRLVFFWSPNAILGILRFKKQKAYSQFLVAISQCSKSWTELVMSNFWVSKPNKTRSWIKAHLFWRIFAHLLLSMKTYICEIFSLSLNTILRMLDFRIT
jgi:hypothetical protein